MANTITSFLENLVAATGEYNAAPVGNLSYLDAVYMDVKPEVARASSTVNVYFPDLGPFSDIGNTGFTDENLNPSMITLTFNQHPGKSWSVTDFEQWKTAVDIKDKFVDPVYKRACEYLNGQIAALITTGNFSTNGVISSAAGRFISTDDASLAWDNLATQKCPVGDSDNMRILTHNNVYRNMMKDTSWAQESLVGAVQAESARQNADLRRAFNSRIAWDQQAPKTTTAVAGTVALTNGSANVVGTGTNFTTTAPVGSWIYFSNDPRPTPYQVLTVTDDTHIVLAANYAGKTASGGTASTILYTSVMMHKYAIAVALRPMPRPDTRVVEYQIVYVRGIPLRIMIGYHQTPNPGYTITADFGYAIGVLRQTWGQIIQS